MKAARCHRQAFTLIELMLVVAIMGIAMAMAYPSIARMIHRAPLTQAVMDITKGCRDARASAILQDVPTELRIFADGHMDVINAPADIDPNAAAAAAAAGPAGPVIAADETPRPKTSSNFAAQLGETVGVELIDINFVDYEGADVAMVKFYPNGTSDEFTIIIKCEAERRKITLEVVTALADVQSL